MNNNLISPNSAHMDSLQIPDNSYAGPSRQYGASRPVSVAVQPSPASVSQSASRRQRASHQVVTAQQQQQQQAEDQPAYRDVYSHPAAVNYTAAHPRRTIPKFGPYILLQTVGEGEFGKVKLGLHSQWGEEVAVKLIRRGNIDTSVRMSKVEREIEVLRTLKHPNIVRLYDVIETDKYIGIILEYASGGELFDHILAHRYLKEKDAAKLFSQLISGVWYIHQKKIVHRDLKLENLLLDRHRNVIITDFGFANRFEHRADDLMQTSCGSPCYAAPELVISEGLYVGSAVDIWSCGVILYAMLAGYLPFDDDPANPDGDNINLLYKYIVNTPLSFPDYVSAEARDLLAMMLVPDPTRRADLRSIMAHPWLATYSYLFEKTVDDLEQVAMEQHQQRRLAYQRQMRQAAAAAAAKDPAKVSRTQSARVEGLLSSAGSSGPPPRSHSYRDHPSGQPELIYDSSVDQSIYSSSSPPVAAPASRKVTNSTLVMPTTTQSSGDDDPFAPPSHAVQIPVTISKPDEVPSAGRNSREGSSQAASSSRHGPPPSSLPQQDPVKKKGAIDRHTIQVEYSDQTAPTQELAPNFSQSIKPPMPVKKDGLPAAPVSTQSTSPPAKEKPKRQSSVDTDRSRPLPATPAVDTPSRAQAPQLSSSTLRANQNRMPTVSVSPASPPVSTEEKSFQSVNTGGTSSTTSSRHRKGISMDKFGLGKIFGTNGDHAAINGSTSRVPSESSAAGASIMEETRASAQNSVSDVPSQSKSSLLSPGGSNGITDADASKKNRRNTLTVMVEPFSRSIKARSKKTPTGETPVKDNDKSVPPSAVTPQKQTTVFPTMGNGPHSGMDMAASTTKARNVMQWFRRKSTAKAAPDNASDMPASHSTDQPLPVPDDSRGEKRNAELPRLPPPAHDTSFSFGKAGRIFTSSPPKDVLRIHHGAVDQTTITTRPPPEVIKHVCQVLDGMGVELKAESEYKYRCVRAKRKKSLGFSGSGNGLAAFTMVGSAASNGVDKRGLPVPSSSSSAGGMLKGLLMRRQSSQVSGVSPSQVSMDDDTGAVASSPVESSPLATHETIYGDTSQDAGDEVRFSIELTRIDRLKDTYSLDIRRLKGNLRSYKFLYDTIRERADLQR